MSLDLSQDHQHIACEKCETVWCAVCVGRIEVKISREWIEQSTDPKLAQLARQQSVAHLN